MKSYELGGPIRANLEITEACPLACKHCYTFWGYAATGKKVISSDEHYSIYHFDAILEKLASLGVRMLTLTGGEPFCKRDLLFHLIRAAKARNMIVFVNTSASIINTSDRENIKSLNANGFLVSLMSCHRDIHNHLAQSKSFDKTVEGIKILTSLGQNVSINMVCSKENYKDIRDTAKFVESLGVNSFSAAPMMAALSYPEYLSMRLDRSELNSVIEDLLWVKDNTNLLTTTLESLPYCAFDINSLSRFRDILSHSYCGAGMTDIAISVTGDIRPCIMSAESVGNILDEEWNVIWSRMSEWRTDSVLPSECRKCAVVGECGGGCRISAKTVTGKIDGYDPYMDSKINVLPWNNCQKVVVASEAALERRTDSLDSLLRISEYAIDRTEPFGGTVFIGCRAVFLKEDAYKLYQELKGMGRFGIKSIASEKEINVVELEHFIQILLDEGIIEPV